MINVVILYVYEANIYAPLITHCSFKQLVYLVETQRTILVEPALAKDRGHKCTVFGSGRNLGVYFNKTLRFLFILVIF